MKNHQVEDEIQWTIGNCSLGLVLIAMSDKGLCAVLLGNDPNELKLEIQRRFPNAILINGDGKMKETLSEIIELVENPYKNINLVLDERGTHFQLSVWKALREIPVGTTISYTEVAKKIGLPKSVRAVASACAANPLAIVTPCHRVVKMDGGLAGYRWGIERKLKQLQLEKAR